MAYGHRQTDARYRLPARLFGVDDARLRCTSRYDGAKTHIPPLKGAMNHILFDSVRLVLGAVFSGNVAPTRPPKDVAERADHVDMRCSVSIHFKRRLVATNRQNRVDRGPSTVDTDTQRHRHF